MTDMLDKVIDSAKKLRKVAKKIEDPDIQGLILDLNLHLADLKMQLVERREEELHQQTDVREDRPASPRAPDSRDRHETGSALTTSPSLWDHGSGSTDGDTPTVS